MLGFQTLKNRSDSDYNLLVEKVIFYNLLRPFITGVEPCFAFTFFALLCFFTGNRHNFALPCFALLSDLGTFTLLCFAFRFWKSNFALLCFALPDFEWIFQSSLPYLRKFWVFGTQNGLKVALRAKVDSIQSYLFRNLA